MGTSGAVLLADDTAMDVRIEWTDAFRKTQSPAKATERTLRRFLSVLKDSDEGPVIRLTLAVLQHRHGVLTATAKRDALNVISRGLGFDRWAEAGAKQLAKRRAVYARIAKQLNAPQPPPRAPKKASTPKRLPFKAGDIVTVPISKARVGYIKILDVDRTGRFAWIALLDLATKPGSHPEAWDDIPLRWFRYRHTSGQYKGLVRGDACWSMSFWENPEVPRDQMVVVGRAPVTAAERRMTTRHTGGTGQWLSVPDRVKQSFRLKAPDFQLFIRKPGPIRLGQRPTHLR